MLDPTVSLVLLGVAVVGVVEFGAYVAAPAWYARLALITARLDRTLDVRGGRVKERLSGLELSGGEYVAGWRNTPGYAWVRMRFKLAVKSSLAVGRVDVAVRSAPSEDDAARERVEIRAWWLPFPLVLYAALIGSLVVLAASRGSTVLAAAMVAAIVCAFDAMIGYFRIQRALEDVVNQMQRELLVDPSEEDVLTD